MDSVPVIFGPLEQPVRLATRGRLFAALIAVACLAVLGVAAFLEPDPAGVGTNTRLGIRPCGLYQSTGLPCAACGMTTSFNHFARGQIISAAWVQPMGLVLALATCATFWASAYIAATGRPAHRLFKRLPAVRLILLTVGFGIAAWAWKIGLTLLHVDGIG